MDLGLAHDNEAWDEYGEKRGVGMLNVEQDINRACRDYLRPFYWLLDEQQCILQSNYPMDHGQAEWSLRKMTFADFCRQLKVECPLRVWDLPNQQVAIEDRIALSTAEGKRYLRLVSQMQEHEGKSHVLLIGFDITESVQVKQQKMKVSLLQNLIDHIPYYLFWKDENSVFLGCNKTFSESAGLPCSEDIVGKTDYDLPWDKTESDAYRLDDQRVMLSKKGKTHIEETQTIDGEEMVLLTSKVPFLDDEGRVRGVIGIYNDITERKKMENACRIATQHAEEASRAKSNLLAIVSHELRTPLHAILGLTQMIQSQYDDTRLLSYHHDIKKSAMTLLNLVNDILDFTQFERGPIYSQSGSV